MSDSQRSETGKNGSIDIAREVDQAYNLLDAAEKNSIHVPRDVVFSITSARKAISRTGKFDNPELETRFWDAYGLLSSIKPNDKATTSYRYFFYVLLILLLICQVYYLAGSLILTHLGAVETEWQHVADSGTYTAQGVQLTGSEMWNRLRRTATAKANYDLARQLMPFFRELQLSEEFFKNYDNYPNMPREKVQFMVNYIKLKGELELHILALSGYILPFLYGALGAFAFLLRKLSDPVARLTYTHDTRVSYTLRLHVGALAGLAVGWFINSNSGNSGFGALSPLALAFAAGYASDLLFTALDKVVAAFSPASSQDMNTEHRGAPLIRGSLAAAKKPAQPDGSVETEEASPSSIHEARPKAA